jgi:hypothetical protein
MIQLLPNSTLKFDCQLFYKLISLQKQNLHSDFLLSTLDVAEQAETIAYDLSAFLSPAEGNLGLALVFSFLSILLGLLNYFSKFMNLT